MSGFASPYDVAYPTGTVQLSAALCPVEELKKECLFMKRIVNDTDYAIQVTPGGYHYCRTEGCGYSTVSAGHTSLSADEFLG